MNDRLRELEHSSSRSHGEHPTPTFEEKSERNKGKGAWVKKKLKRKLGKKNRESKNEPSKIKNSRRRKDEKRTEQEQGKRDVEMGQMQQQDQKEGRETSNSFFRQVEAIQNSIGKITNATSQIEKMNDKMLQAILAKEENQISATLQHTVESTSKRAKDAKKILDDLKKENEKHEAERDINETDLRVRENMCNSLTTKFINEMKSYQTAQLKFKAGLKTKVKRQIKIVKSDVTDDEVNEVIRSGGGVEQLYRKRIESGRIPDQVKTVYANVAGKYQDIIRLEQSVAEVHQLFLDLALLTEQQGEMLDQIEFQVHQAGDFIDVANEDVYEATESQKKIRKKHCLIIGIVSVVLLVIIISM